METCKRCNQPIWITEQLTQIGDDIDEKTYPWIGNFRIFMKKYVPCDEMWIIDRKQGKVHKIINIGE